MTDLPPLSPPRAGDPINNECSYRAKASSRHQAAHWNAHLADNPIFGPACGLIVGVASQRDAAGRYPLIWVPAP